MWKIWQDKNIRKGHSEEENYQKDLQRENYLDSQIRNMTKNIGKDQRGIGDSEKESDQGKKIETIKEFEREYWQDMEDIARQECEKETYRKGELPGRFTARKLFRWLDKRYNQEYWGRLERNWRWWKGKQSGKGR